MIDKETQQRVKEWVSKQTGQSYPSSNQIVTKAIVLKNPNRIAAFEQTYPNFVCYRRSKNGYDSRYIDSHTEELWRVVIAEVLDTIKLSLIQRQIKKYLILELFLVWLIMLVR